MSQTATNPQTGERFVLVGDQWVPVTQTATNPQTGEKFGLAGDAWVPIGTTTPTPAPAPPVTQKAAPPREVKPAGIFDYFTDRQAAIKQDREYRAYLQDRMQRAELEDIETQTGFFDRLGDLFSRGLLSARSGIKDVEAAIETDPVLKKQFTQEARRFAADKGVEITGTTTEQDVKDNFLRNAIPYIIEKGAESLPQMFAATNPLGVLGVALPSNLGMQAREAAELQGRQDVSGTDVAKVAPGALAVTALDTLGLGGILAAPAKTALGRIGKAALLEGGTEAIQSAIEYANPRVVTGSDVDAGELFEQAAFGALAGGGIGGGLRGAGELAAAPFRKRGEAALDVGAATDPAVRAEFQRLAAQEVAAVMAADPELDQKAAVELVSERAEELLSQAAANTVAATEGEADVVPDADTGVDVTGGGGAGVAPNLRPAPTETGTPELGEAVRGRLERPVSGVSVPDVGEGAGVAPLVAPTAAQVKATVPVIEQAFDAAAIDFEDTFGVKKLNAEQKKQAARIVIQSPEVDPYDAIGSVLERGQVLRGEKPAVKKLPGASRTVVNIGGQEQVIEAPSTPEGAQQLRAALGVAPDAEIASRAEKSRTYNQASRDFDAGLITRDEFRAKVGLPAVTPAMATPAMTTPEVAAPEVAAPEVATPPAPPAQRVMNDLAGIGSVNPENTNEVLVEGGGVQLTPVSPSVVQLDSLRAVEKGGGRKAMEQLTKVADDNGTALQLSPEPFAAPVGKEMSPTELTEWYRGFGFQEQPDGTMVRPAATTAPSIMQEAAATPQEIVNNLDTFAVTEAQDRGLDVPMFREGVRDIQRGAEPLTDQQILDAQGPEALDAYKSGMQWAQERIADATQQAAPKKAAAKAKAIGTTGAKAKQVKAVIERKPGKTVAEKLFNMAQAEFDQTPKEEVVGQVTPYDAEYETIRSKPGVNVKRMAKLLDSSLYGDPSDMGQVCIKEVLQNSFDATRTAVNKGQVAQGNIEVVVSDDGRKLTIKDNGVGMPPEILGGKFLEIAGTAKEGDKNAGGFGIAKMLFLYQNKGIRVVTARDGRISELNTTGEQLFDSLENTENAPDIEVREFEPVDDLAFPDGHGTIIELTIPEKIGEHKIKELPRWLDSIESLALSPMFSNIAVTFQGRSYADPEVLETGANFPIQDYTQFVGVKFSWGTAKVYVTKNKTEQRYGDNMHVLSNGLWQFSSRVSKDPTSMWSDPVPYRFYVDIVPSVKAEDFGYPFTFNRQGFTDLAKSDFSKVKAYIDALYAYKSRAGEATSFGNIQYFDANGQLGPVIDLTPDIPVQDTAFTRVAEGDQITVGEDGSLLVNGKPMPELTPDQLKAGIPSASDLTISPDLIDTNSVMVHDNADVIIKSTGERMSIPDFMRRQFGERFDDFMRFNGDTFLKLRNEVARVMGYDGLRDEAIGVSFDPEYRGVSIRLPFSGSFINPLVPKYGDGLRAGYGIFGTMIHELAHHKVRSHNANFPAEMQDILLNMESDVGFAYQRFKDNFADTIAADYADIVKLGVELFSAKNPDISVEYRGNKFTDGSPEQAPEGAGTGGTGDLRGPSGEGSAGESLLGPAYERRSGAGERGQPEGSQGGTAPLNTANVDAAVSTKLTKSQIRRLEEAAGIRRVKLNAMQKRIARSKSAEETMSLAGKLMLMARNPDEDVGILSSLFNSIPPTVFQKLLGPMMTDDVVRLGERAGMKAVSRIDNLMRNEYLPYVNRMMHRASELADKWADFTSQSEKGANALGDVMFFSNMIDADPSTAPNVTEYLKRDREYQSLNARYLAEKDPKKKSNLKGQITKRRGEIQRLYFGATDPDGTEIAGWNDVPPEGKKLFRMARDHYRNDFKEHYRLLMQRIDDSGFEEEDATRLKASVNKMFADASERTVYFPLKRFGEYWVTVGKGASGEFHMFETAAAQDAFLARLRSEKETRSVSSGFGRDSLRNMVGNRDASAALKGILDIIDEGGVSDIDLLKDHIFQMYLTALPEADMRRRFIHRQFKTGFSTDTLRTFATTAVASANQLGRLAYNYKFRNAIDESYSETEGNPSKRRLDTITRELELRVNGMLSPDPENGVDWFLSLGAKGTFLFLLSSPKSALMNLTQLHIVGLPALSAEFGEAATAKMAARYTGGFVTGKRIANPFRDEEGNVKLQIPKVSLEDSAYIQGLKDTDPDRYEAIQRAWQFAMEHDVTQSTFAAATDVYERSNTPTETYGFMQSMRRGELITAAQRATANTAEAMGALFHNVERVGREVMYMSAFELAYDRALKQGKTPREAADIAIPMAGDLTNKGMFDFSNWNKSRYSKSRVGRLPLQMRSYSLAMTSLLFRSFTGMLPFFNKEGKLASARMFFGVGAMTALYGGFRASQFYVLAMMGYGLYEFVKQAVQGDDEEQEAEQGYLTPETIDRELMKFADDQGRELSKKDMEFYIRSVWVPETFGPGGTMATALGLSDENAAKLARASDIGLPAYFGVDISNSVSLGDLWHPVTIKSDDPEIAFFERLGRLLLGPSGALVVAPFKAVDQANKGDFDKAIETMMPAAVRGYVKSERLQEEGLVIGKNRDVVLKDPSFYDTYSSVMQSLGFAEAETSRAMQLDIKAGEIEQEVASEKTKLLDRRYRAVLDTATDTTGKAEQALREVERAIQIYNLNYPSNAISEDTKERSFQQKQQEAAEKMYGLGVNPNIPVRQPLMEERAGQMVREE